MSRLPPLGPRGEGWVAIQGVLLLAEVVVGTTRPAWSGSARLATTLLGVVLMAAGGLLGARGILDLRVGFTAFPRPIDRAELIEHGAYRLVRHPIYGGIVIVSSGYGLLAASPLAIAGALVLLGFLRLKSAREEAWLLERYPGYAAYRSRTRRILPWLY